jgi:hypothetical protein
MISLLRQTSRLIGDITSIPGDDRLNSPERLVPICYWCAGKESATMEAQKNRSGAAFTPHIAEVTVIHSSNPPLEKHMTSRPKDPLMKRLMRWLVPDQRVANRHLMPPLTAYLGMVRTSKEFKVGDVSVAGFYMLTDERWIPGTGFPVTLERTDAAGQGRTLTLHATVVRTGDDGVGFTFLNPAEEDQNDEGGGTRVDLTKIAQFLQGLPLSNPDSLERAS